jgi:hypothetical protein
MSTSIAHLAPPPDTQLAIPQSLQSLIIAHRLLLLLAADGVREVRDIVVGLAHAV